MPRARRAGRPARGHRGGRGPGRPTYAQIQEFVYTQTGSKKRGVERSTFPKFVEVALAALCASAP